MSGVEAGQRALAELSAAPLHFPQKYDPVADTVLLIRMDETTYRAASFLDDRILTPKTQGFWAPFAVVERAAAPVVAKPLHFIFHTGHVGSTLLSRLLDEIAPVLPLREPLALRTLAELHDSLGKAHAYLGPDAFAQHLETFLRLWSRGFPANQAVVLKATSSAGRLAPALLKARPEAKAVYLNLAAEPYLATLFAGANTALDLRGHAPGRIQRLEQQLGEPPLALHAATLGELAAMSWLAETLAQREAKAVAPERVLLLDFERLLTKLEETMAEAAVHFGLAVPQEKLAALARSPALTRYSKAPEHAYSPDLRAQLLAQARREHAAELRKGMAWLEAAGRRHAAAAAVLAAG